VSCVKWRQARAVSTRRSRVCGFYTSSSTSFLLANCSVLVAQFIRRIRPETQRGHRFRNRVRLMISCLRIDGLVSSLVSTLRRHYSVQLSAKIPSGSCSFGVRYRDNYVIDQMSSYLITTVRAPLFAISYSLPRSTAPDAKHRLQFMTSTRPVTRATAWPHYSTRYIFRQRTTQPATRILSCSPWNASAAGSRRQRTSGTAHRPKIGRNLSLLCPNGFWLGVLPSIISD